MVRITKAENDYIFEILGLHKLWSLRNKIVVKKENIVSITQNLDEFTTWKGWRMPGTQLPYVITAGTFIKKGKRNFWDVCNKNNALTIQLKDSYYDKLIIEVENTEEIINLLNNK